MKKIYIAPKSISIELGMESLIADSDKASIASFQSVGNEYNAGDVDYVKQGSLWDEEW